MNRQAILLASFLTTLAAAAAQSPNRQVSVPQIGMARFADGSVHQVDGLAANFLVRSRTHTAADHICFSRAASLTSLNGVIRLFDTNGALLGKYKSSEANPLLAVTSTGPTSAAIWLPATHTLVRWTGTQFAETPIDDSPFSGGYATSVSVSATQAQFLAARPDSSIVRVSAALPSGLITNVSIIPGVSGWAVTSYGWTLSWTPKGFIATQPNGNTQNTELSQTDLDVGDLLIEQMSDHWLHFSSRSLSLNWAVYVDTDTVSTFLLPPPRPVELRQ